MISKVLTATIMVALFLIQLSAADGCKSIIAKESATPGDHTLHMKIRDPSRGGDQVLFICEPGYQYTYHHPTTGEDMQFTVENRVIGVASSGDVPPDIMKAGMALTDKGISYGDNDIDLLYVNPSEYAWDDFDWLRYGYQTARDEDSSVRLLVDEAVHDLHATGKGEVLYVVGPDHAYVIEANAKDAVVDEVEDVYVRTNYPVKLWETATKESHQYGPHFDSSFDGWARMGETVKLGPGCLYGVRLENINENSIKVRSIHRETESIELKKGEVKSLCGFRVGLKETDTQGIPGARITLCYHYLEWEQRMDKMVMEEYGNITIEDMMSWSRLHGEDLGNLRPMCEGSSDNAESVAIYSIPDYNPGVLSSFWYTCHPCASIYAPVHICVEELHEPYTTEEACQLFEENLKRRDHDNDTLLFESVESVFIDENSFIEGLAQGLLRQERVDLVPEFMTHSDLMMQEHALLMVKLSMSEQPGILEDVWKCDYEKTFEGFQEVLPQLTEKGSHYLLEICERTAFHKVRQAMIMDGNDTSGARAAYDEYKTARRNKEDGNYEEALDGFKTSFLISQRILEGEDYHEYIESSDSISNTTVISIIGIMVICSAGIVFLFRKKGRS